MDAKLWMTGLVLLMAAATQAQDDQIVPVPHQNPSEDSGRAAGTAADLLQSIYSTCLESGDLSCAKHKVLAFLSAATSQDKVRISRDLSIVRSDTQPADVDEVSQDAVDGDSAAAHIADPERRQLVLQLSRVSRFLDTHELRVRLPKEILSPELLAYVPHFLLKNLPQEVRVPLADNAVEGRSRGGMLRKVIIPFLLGIKFKISTLLPLALALIALKTWKALTLGLLSIVLSAAMVIFKITKPKVLNYEVVHLPHPAPVVEHYEHHHGYGRALDAHPLAYRAYFKQQTA